MNTGQTELEVRQVLSKLMAGWDTGDGTAFASSFTEDADFVPYFGIHVQGRKGIADAHQSIFDGFMKGSKLRYDLQSLRNIEENVFIVHTLGMVIRAGSADSNAKPTAIQSFVMVKRDGKLEIEAFQNTLIENAP